MDQVPVAEIATPQRHLERIEDEVGAEVVGELPADDHPRVNVEDERDVQPALPRRHVGDVGEPQLVRSLGDEVALDQVRRPGRVSSGMVVNCLRPRCTPRRPMSAITRADGAAGDRRNPPCATSCRPARPIARVVRRPHPTDLDLVQLVADRARRRRPPLRRVKRPLGQTDGPTHHGDGPLVAVLVDEGDHHRGRGSASCANTWSPP